MSSFFLVLLILALLAVFGVLVAGMIGVASGGDPHRSNRLMRWRILLQGLAVIIFVLLMLSRR